MSTAKGQKAPGDAGSGPEYQAARKAVIALLIAASRHNAAHNQSGYIIRRPTGDERFFCDLVLVFKLTEETYGITLAYEKGLPRALVMRPEWFTCNSSGRWCIPKRNVSCVYKALKKCLKGAIAS